MAIQEQRTLRTSASFVTAGEMRTFIDKMPDDLSIMISRAVADRPGESDSYVFSGTVKRTATPVK